MRFLNTWFPICLVLISCSLAHAQYPFDLESTTEILTGQSYSLPGDKALAVQDDELWYMRRNGQGSPPALFLGTAEEIDSAPMPWSELVTETHFENNPSSSPTGDPVTATRYIEAAIYELDGPNYTGYAVGLVQRLEYSSGTASGSITIIDPGALSFDLGEAYALFDRLTAGPSTPPTVTPGTSCTEQCLGDYNTEVANAYDQYVTNLKTFCGIGGLGGGFVTGCVTGVAVCGWWIPPASTAACCAIGGMLGSAAGLSACAYVYTEQYESALRQAERDYINCMAGCGYTIVFD